MTTLGQLGELGRAPTTRRPRSVAVFRRAGRSGRPGRSGPLDEVVVVSDALHGVQDAIRHADPDDLLEPLVFARDGYRHTAAAQSPILAGFLSTAEQATELTERLEVPNLRRYRVQSGLAGLGLQVDGTRLELAVRLRQALHPERAVHELAQLAGVGLSAAEQGYALVRASSGGVAQPLLETQVIALRQQASMVRTLNLMLVENLPDRRLDGADVGASTAPGQDRSGDEST